MLAAAPSAFWEFQLKYIESKHVPINKQQQARLSCVGAACSGSADRARLKIDNNFVVVVVAGMLCRFWHTINLSNSKPYFSLGGDRVHRYK